jgi:hypothetical protein
VEVVNRLVDVYDLLGRVVWKSNVNVNLLAFTLVNFDSLKLRKLIAKKLKKKPPKIREKGRPKLRAKNRPKLRAKNRKPLKHRRARRPMSRAKATLRAPKVMQKATVKKIWRVRTILSKIQKNQRIQEAQRILKNPKKWLMIRRILLRATRWLKRPVVAIAAVAIVVEEVVEGFVEVAADGAAAAVMEAGTVVLAKAKKKPSSFLPMNNFLNP